MIEAWRKSILQVSWALNISPKVKNERFKLCTTRGTRGAEGEAIHRRWRSAAADKSGGPGVVREFLLVRYSGVVPSRSWVELWTNDLLAAADSS